MRHVHIRIGVLGCLIAGMAVLTGTAAQAAPAANSITGCTASPTTATVTAESPQASSTFTWFPDPSKQAIAEVFLDGTLVVSTSPQPVGGNAVFPMGDPWSEALAGKTWRFDVYAFDASNQKTGGVLCTFTTTYAPVGGGGDSDGGNWDIDLDHYLQRVSPTDVLPNTL